MNTERKAAWEQPRILKKPWFILIMSGFQGGLFIVATTLMDLWPDGHYVRFDVFLVRAAIGYSVVGFPVAWMSWANMEKQPRKAMQDDERLNRAGIRRILFVLFIIGVSVLLFSNYRRILPFLPQLSSCDVSSETLAGYADRYEIPEGVLRILFSIMEEQGMDCTRANNNLGGQVYRHRELLRRLEEVHSDAPEVLRLWKEARQAAVLGAYSRTAALLLRAEDHDLAALATLDPRDATARAKRRISASATSVAIAGLEEVRLRYIEAAERYRKAAELLPPNNGAKRADYLRRAADALGFIGLNIGSNDRQERAAALAEARSLYEQSLTLYQEIGDKEGQAKILYNLSTRYNTRDDTRYNLRYLEESLRLYQEIGNRNGEAMALNSLGLKYDAQGDTATALRYLKQSLRVSQEAGDKQNERTAAWNIGLHYQEQEELRMAEPYIRRAVELGEELDIDDVGEGRRRLEKIRAAQR